MKKLNGFESYLVLEGLASMRRQMKLDILEIEAEGKNSIMTTGYVDMVVDEGMICSCQVGPTVLLFLPDTLVSNQS